MKLKKILKNRPKINYPKILINEPPEIASFGTELNKLMSHSFSGSAFHINKRLIVLLIIIATVCTTVVAGVVLRKYIVGEYNIAYKKTTADKTMLWTYVFDPEIIGVFETREEALAAEEEILELISQNKAEDLGDGVYTAVLSNGKEVTYDTSGLPIEILKASDRESAIRQMTDEIEELHDRGEYTKVYTGKINIEGIGDIVIHEYTYTLSSGHQITVRSNR